MSRVPTIDRIVDSPPVQADASNSSRCEGRTAKIGSGESTKNPSAMIMAPPALVLGHVDDDIGLAKQIIRHDPASIHPEECAMTIRMSDGGISDDVVVDGCGCDERSSHQIVGGP